MCSIKNSSQPSRLLHIDLVMCIVPPVGLRPRPKDDVPAQRENGLVWSSLAQVTGRRGHGLGILGTHISFRDTVTPILAVMLMRMVARTLHREIKMNTGMHISGVMMRRLPTALAQTPGTYP